MTINPIISAEKVCTARSTSALTFEFQYTKHSIIILIGEDGPEELLLDPNQVGGDVHFFEISPNHRYVAYGYEYCGDERYTLTILDTATNKILEEETVDNLGKSPNSCQI